MEELRWLHNILENTFKIIILWKLGQQSQIKLP